MILSSLRIDTSGALDETGAACEKGFSMLALLAAALPAFVNALAVSAGTQAGGIIIQALIPKPKPPDQVSQEQAQANQNFMDALSKINKPSPSPDLVWGAADAMFPIVAKNPDYLAQAEDALKRFDPPNYDFAKQLQETIHPVISEHSDIQALLDSMGPKPTQPSSAQTFVLPQVKSLPLPDAIKTVKWPQTTQFVWPPQFQLPASPTSFVWPGQASK